MARGKRGGGWWLRTNIPEIDLVGADARPVGRYGFVGTIKWRRERKITAAELSALANDAASLPGLDDGAPLVAVCPAGAVPDEKLTQVWTADGLLEAWA